MDYKYKYLKYKNKYLLLKSLGGKPKVGDIIEGKPKVGDIIEGSRNHEYWGIISKEKKPGIYILNTGRIANTHDIWIKWKIRDSVFMDKPLIYPLGGAKIGKEVEGIEFKDSWGKIVREKKDHWILNNNRIVKKKTMGITWKIKDEPIVKPFLAKRIIHYIIKSHGAQLQNKKKIIKERGVLYNLYGYSNQNMSCSKGDNISNSLLNPEIKNIKPNVQYNHNFRAKYRDFILGCDYKGNGYPCFTGESGKNKNGKFNSNIIRIKNPLFEQKIWSLDNKELKKEYPQLNNKPKLSQLLNLIIIPDFLKLTNNSSLEDAINKGDICSLHCLFCYSPYE